jgi:uncharacterized Zn finger protein
MQMSDIIPFKCPSCGGEQFRQVRQVKTYDDFVGAACSGCGHVITDEEIKDSARQIALEEIKKALKR